MEFSNLDLFRPCFHYSLFKVKTVLTDTIVKSSNQPQAHLVHPYVDDIRLQKWQVPDESTNRDQLECMLQLIQATLAKGLATNRDQLECILQFIQASLSKGLDKCPTTDEEARALVDAIVEKIHRLNY